MMKRYSMLLLSGLLGMSAVFGLAKGKVQAAEAESAQEVTQEATQEAKEEQPIKAEPIGEESEQALFLNLTNLTGMDIVGMELSSDGKTFGENLLGDQVFADQESRDWFVKASGEASEKDAQEAATEEAAEKAVEEAAEKAAAEEEKVSYDLRLTFKDETKATLHDLPFGLTQKAEVGYTGKVAYLTYEDEKGELVNTKKAEKKLLKKAVEKAEAATEPASEETTEPASEQTTQAASEETSQAVAESAPQVDYSNYDYSVDSGNSDNSTNTYEESYNYDYNYDSGNGESEYYSNDYDYSYSGGGTDYFEDDYDEPIGGDNSGGDACLDDGISLN